jgi:gluconate 5-dehydrogenase
VTAHAVFDVAGTVALVTGSSRGIGLALARGLAEARATVVLNGRDAGALARARDALAAETGAAVHALAFDVTDADAVAAGVAAAEELAGPLDTLVNNAGMQFRRDLREFPLEAWNRLLATNLTSAFLVGREVAARMVPRGRGAIVNVCSVQSELARPGIAPYAATKGALKLLTQGMCADLAPHGLTVNGLGPGYFDTELTQALVADREFDRWLRARTPAGRWGDVRELIGPLLFLVSPAAAFVNGQVLYVDGGLLAVV